MLMGLHVLTFQAVFYHQLCGQLDGVFQRFFVVAALVDAHFNANAVQVAAVRVKLVRGVVGGFIVGQVVVDLVVVYGVVPGARVVVRAKAAKERRVCRRIGGRAEIVSLVDDNPFHQAFLSRPAGAVLGHVLFINRDIANVFQLNWLGHAGVVPAHQRGNRPDKDADNRQENHEHQQRAPIAPAPPARDVFRVLPVIFCVEPHKLQTNRLLFPSFLILLLLYYAGAGQTTAKL